MFFQQKHPASNCTCFAALSFLSLSVSLRYQYSIALLKKKKTQGKLSILSPPSGPVLQQLFCMLERVFEWAMMGVGGVISLKTQSIVMQNKKMRQHAQKGDPVSRSFYATSSSAQPGRAPSETPSPYPPALKPPSPASPFCWLWACCACCRLNAGKLTVRVCEAPPRAFWVA